MLNHLSHPGAPVIMIFNQFYLPTKIKPGKPLEKLSQDGEHRTTQDRRHRISWRCSPGDLEWVTFKLLCASAFSALN